MIKSNLSTSLSLILVLLLWVTTNGQESPPSPRCGLPINASDEERVRFAQNLEFLEAEFFLSGALGSGLDSVAPYLAKGGPPPVGARRANLDPLTRRIIEEFGYQEVGHLR